MKSSKSMVLKKTYEIYDCRNDLFHEGEKENIVKYLHPLESLATRIIEEIRGRIPI